MNTLGNSNKHTHLATLALALALIIMGGVAQAKPAANIAPSLGSAAQAYDWNFTNAADYFLVNAVVTALPVDGSAYVAPLPEDEASVFAQINTQANHLGIGDITGGGFTLTGMNNPDAVYGSLYLSPTGGSGSDVLILLSPMGFTGSDGNLVYTFDANQRRLPYTGCRCRW